MSTSNGILIVGSGSFVIGDAWGPGVVLRSVLAWLVHRNRMDPVAVTCRSEERRVEVVKGVELAVKDVGAANAVSVIGVDEIERRIAERPLAVFVCVPDRVHKQYVEIAVRAGVPVFVVKPVTGDLATALELEATCRAREAAVWVDYHKRFDPSNLLLRSMVARAEYGRPMHYFVQYSQPRALPLQLEWAKDVNPLTYIGCHYLDQLAYVFPGVTAQRVMAVAIDGLVRRDVGGRAHDAVVCEVILQYQGQPLLASLHVGWANPLGAPAKSFQRVELDCERGKILADQMARGFQIWSDEQTHETNPYFFQRLPDPETGRLTVSGYGYESVARYLDFCAAPPDERRHLRASPTLPWIENTLFAERVLGAATASLADGSVWKDVVA